MGMAGQDSCGRGPSGRISGYPGPEFKPGEPLPRLRGAPAASIQAEATAAEQADQADHDQVDGHDVGQQARTHQDEDAGDEGEDGGEGDGHGGAPWVIGDRLDFRRARVHEIRGDSNILTGLP